MLDSRSTASRWTQWLPARPPVPPLQLWHNWQECTVCQPPRCPPSDWRRRANCECYMNSSGSMLMPTKLLKCLQPVHLLLKFFTSTHMGAHRTTCMNVHVNTCSHAGGLLPSCIAFLIRSAIIRCTSEYLIYAQIMQ